MFRKMKRLFAALKLPAATRAYPVFFPTAPLALDEGRPPEDSLPQNKNAPKSSDELQVVKNETERGNAASKQRSKHVLCWCAGRCAELQTIDPKTKNFSRVAPSLTMSQKYLCISLRDTALGGINYRQSGGAGLAHGGRVC